MARKFFLYVICAMILVFFIPGFVKIQELNTKNKLLAEKILEARKDNLALKKEVEKLKNDSVYLESVARDKMGVVKKGEVIYHIVGEGKK